VCSVYDYDVVGCVSEYVSVLFFPRESLLLSENSAIIKRELTEWGEMHLMDECSVVEKWFSCTYAPFLPLIAKTANASSRNEQPNR